MPSSTPPPSFGADVTGYCHRRDARSDDPGAGKSPPPPRRRDQEGGCHRSRTKCRFTAAVSLSASKSNSAAARRTPLRLARGNRGSPIKSRRANGAVSHRGVARDSQETIGNRPTSTFHAQARRAAGGRGKGVREIAGRAAQLKALDRIDKAASRWRSSASHPAGLQPDQETARERWRRDQAKDRGGDVPRSLRAISNG